MILKKTTVNIFQALLITNVFHLRSLCSFSKRSNAKYIMTKHNGFIIKETDNKVIQTSVFWSLSLDCTQSLRGGPILKYLKYMNK